MSILTRTNLLPITLFPEKCRMSLRVSDVLVRTAALHDAPVAHGLALGVFAHVCGRGHRVHSRSRHDVVPSPPAAT